MCVHMCVRERDVGRGTAAVRVDHGCCCVVVVSINISAQRHLGPVRFSLVCCLHLESFVRARECVCVCVKRGAKEVTE